VTKAYLSVALFQRLKDFADQNYYVHRQVESRVSDRVSGGVSAGVDLEQVTARLALAESNVLTEAANLHDTIAELQRLTGERVASERLPFPVLLPELIGGSRTEVLRRAVGQQPSRSAVD
jgi:adhesin transport system outer membrane protein